MSTYLYTHTRAKLAALLACAPERGREIGIFATGAGVCGAGKGRAGQGRTGAGEDSKGESRVGEWGGGGDESPGCNMNPSQDERSEEWAQRRGRDRETEE